MGVYIWGIVGCWEVFRSVWRIVDACKLMFGPALTQKRREETRRSTLSYLEARAWSVALRLVLESRNRTCTSPLAGGTVSARGTSGNRPWWSVMANKNVLHSNIGNWRNTPKMQSLGQPIDENRTVFASLQVYTEWMNEESGTAHRGKPQF